MYKIGLTGGIGTGKSTVLNFFKAQGVKTIDADKIAKELVRPGQDALAIVVKSFGNKIIDKGGNLDRKKLGDIVFSDKSKLNQLNEIMHQLIINEMNKKAEYLKKNGCNTVIFDVPLLIETNFYKKMDEVWLVYADNKSVINRVIVRNNLSELKVKQRIESQMSIDEKKNYADVIINNNKGILNLEVELERLWQNKKHLFRKGKIK